MAHFENTVKLINKIKKGANICIYGSNNIAIINIRINKKIQKRYNRSILFGFQQKWSNM